VAFDGEESSRIVSLEVARHLAAAVMDTMTYASAATLPLSIAQNSKYSVVAESEFVPFDLSYISVDNGFYGLSS
jgi:hypothetical protein